MADISISLLKQLLQNDTPFSEADLMHVFILLIIVDLILNVFAVGCEWKIFHL